MDAAATDRIKVLVLGDSGVGKSSLVHLIVHGGPLASGSWTIGCGIEILTHDYQAGLGGQKTCLVELWDVGGSRSHMIARPLFYNQFHGIILVHDATNSKSHDNLRKWLGEVFNTERGRASTSFSLGRLFGAPPDEPLEFDIESFVEKNIPVLVVATKIDLPSSRRLTTSSIAQDCAAEELAVNCCDPKSFSSTSSNLVKLNRFLDCVIDRKYRPLAGRRMATTASNVQRTANSHVVDFDRFSHFD